MNIVFWLLAERKCNIWVQRIQIVSISLCFMEVNGKKKRKLYKSTSAWFRGSIFEQTPFRHAYCVHSTSHHSINVIDEVRLGISFPPSHTSGSFHTFQLPCLSARDVLYWRGRCESFSSSCRLTFLFFWLYILYVTVPPMLLHTLHHKPARPATFSALTVISWLCCSPNCFLFWYRLTSLESFEMHLFNQLCAGL